MRTTRRRLGPIAAVATVTALLAGCAVSPKPAIPSGGVGRLAVDQGQASALLSDYRRAHGLTSVTSDPVLQRVAQAQAEAMASANELSHTVAGSLPDRLSSSGRAKGASIENVSAGYGTLDAALAGWRRSPQHNDNLLYAPMRRMGVAAATAPGTRYKTFWSLIMTD